MKSGLLQDAERDFTAEVVSDFLATGFYTDVEHALICFEHEHEALWAALADYRYRVFPVAYPRAALLSAGGKSHG